MITLDDKYRFEDFGFICEPGYDDSITPIFDRKTYSIPGVEGVIPFGTEVKEKPFSYPLMIMERFHIEMQRKFEMLTDFSLINTEIQGRLRWYVIMTQVNFIM